MKRELKGFIVGIIITAILMSSVAFAAGIDVVFNAVNISVNGKKVAADNILYNGTTYVPLRAVADMFGKDVGWDADTNTALINDKGSDPVNEEKLVESSGETLSQKNAVAKAKSYLEYTAFSKSGLVKQLEFEGFSNEDATYAVNKISVDWKEQAVLKGKSYLDYTSFSRIGLIDQLKYEGFTNEEAIHAVDQIGL
jgi:hypothetical protein